MDCFISYSSADIEIAILLKQRLTGRGISVFLAVQSIPPGEDWSSLIQTAVKRCEVVCLLDSANSRKSPSVQQEAGMALASGSVIIPISLDGKMEELPGWLSGVEAIRATPDVLDEALTLVTDQVSNCLGASWAALPGKFQDPDTVCASVLRTVWLDQFSDHERFGAWSRQCERYLRIYYGEEAVPSTVSQGASLTFTGIVTEHVSTLTSVSSGHIAELARDALRRAEVFILASQDRAQGGFGRRSSEVGTRTGRSIILDLRHTCWAIRTLLCIDANRFSDQIARGLRWLAWRVQNLDEPDRWCWSMAPLLALMADRRLLDIDEWQKVCISLRERVQLDIEESFDGRWFSWVKGEEREKGSLFSIDNALYVLYCLKDSIDLSEKLQRQRREAIQGLLARSQPVPDDPSARGIPLFHSGLPEVGPTAQLLEVLAQDEPQSTKSGLARFIVRHLASRRTMPYTFSWHLSAALAIPEIRDLSLDSISGS